MRGLLLNISAMYLIFRCILAGWLTYLAVRRMRVCASVWPMGRLLASLTAPDRIERAGDGPANAYGGHESVPGLLGL